MAEYALLIDGVFHEIRSYAEKPQDIPHKQVRWHDVVRRKGATEHTGLENDAWVIQTIDPAGLPPPVPKIVTPRQVRLLLLSQGLLEQVEQMIAAQDESIRITWEYAIEFSRDDPLLNNLAASLGLSEDQIDQFFIAAAKL